MSVRERRGDRREAGGRGESPVGRLIAPVPPGRAAVPERGAGLDADALRVSVSDWYPAVRGVARRVTVVASARDGERGDAVPVCRARHPDGTVRRVASDDAGCATRGVGRHTTVTSDPAGRLAPRLGTEADLDPVATTGVGGTAGGPPVLAPLVVVAPAAADHRRTGERRDA